MDHSDTTPLRSSTGHESAPMESSDSCEPALPGKAMDSETNSANEEAQYWKHMAAKDGQLMNSAVLAKQRYGELPVKTLYGKYCSVKYRKIYSGIEYLIFL